MSALKGTVALVAGGTRGAGRGIAAELGAAGATVYVTGRSTRSHRSEMDRPETIEETAELVTAAGGEGIAVRVDHLDPAQVAALVRRSDAEQGRLDVLVNDVWGADHLFEFGKPLWEQSLENGLRLLRLAIETHAITSHRALPLLIRRPGGLATFPADEACPSRELRTRVHSTVTTSHDLTRSVLTSCTTTHRLPRAPTSDLPRGAKPPFGTPARNLEPP